MTGRIRFRRIATAPAEADPVRDVAVAIDRLPGEQQRDAIRHRCAEIVDALTDRADASPGARADDGVDTAALVRSLIAAVTPIDPARAWLLLAVLCGRYPDGARVASIIRAAELEGALPVVVGVLDDVAEAASTGHGGSWPEVRVLTGRTLVDVHHTATAGFATGIQRVTRETTRRWFGAHDLTLVGWHQDLSGMRVLTPVEGRRACWGGPEVEVPEGDPLMVPWRCRYILPELAAEVVRAGYLQTMAQYSGTSLNMIGYDLVPMTTAETAHEGMVPGFARNLAAARYAEVVVPISEGAAVEYRGWRAMLAGAGLAGPRVEPVVLPAEAQPETPESTALAKARIPVGTLPAVLVVGSHEPRKNHLAILHAAELLWREGQAFSLCFIGGNSWNSQEFTTTLEALRSAGRPVEALSAADDDLLWGAYRVARFTVFPSINEGFGLPVAESLACGTPVITSGFGSMKEIADDGGGALLVDPRDDLSLAGAMRALLVDDDLLDELRRQARARPERTWDTYAEQTWRALTGEAEEADADPKGVMVPPLPAFSGTAATDRPNVREFSMELSVAEDLRAARAMLAEPDDAGRRRGRVRRMVRRGTRVLTHRLAAASGHLADAVQRIDDRQRADAADLRGELSRVADAAALARQHADAVGRDVESRAEQRDEQALAELRMTAARLESAMASVGALEATVREFRSRLAVTEQAAAHQRSELRRARTQLARAQRPATGRPDSDEAHEADPVPAGGPAAVEWTADALDQQGYLDFEERFRGSREEIRARQLDAVNYVRELRPGDGPLLDIACGRGEWLGILGAEGIEAYGVDSNAAMIADAAAAGLDVRHEDALVHLATVKESSLQGLSAFHFVEHIPLGALVSMLDDALVALRPGGILLFETPNPTNLMVGSASFYLDPTHVRPVHPEFLSFLVESRGFTDVQIDYVHPAVPAETMIASGPPDGYPDARLNRAVTAVETFVYGPQDYVLTARRPRTAEPITVASPA